MPETHSGAAPGWAPADGPAASASRPAQPPDGAQTVTVYGAFSSPYCYLASLRTDRLAHTSLVVDWRMLAPEPTLPVTARRLDAAGLERLQKQLDAVRRHLLPGEDLPVRIPSFVPNTRPAVAGYAEAYGVGVAHTVRRLLFDSYWLGGADIGNPEVLRTLLVGPIRLGQSTSWPLREAGYAVSLAGGPITTAAYHRILDWRDQWQQAAREALPVLIGDGQPLAGADALTWLGQALVDERVPEPAGPGSALSPHTGPAGALPSPAPASEAAAVIQSIQSDPALLSARDRVYRMAGGIAPQGWIRPAITQPGRPDGEVAT